MAVAEQVILTGTWETDRTHSSVAFEVGHSGISTFRGSFSEFRANLVSSPEGLALDGAAKVDSITIDEPNLRGHLLSPEFFDAERYPEVGFSAKEIEIAADGTVATRGQLELAGKNNEVEVSGRLSGSGPGLDGSERVGLELTAEIDRTKYGMDWNADLPNGNKALADDVRLIVSLELVRSAE